MNKKSIAFSINHFKLCIISSEKIAVEHNVTLDGQISQSYFKRIFMY